MANFKTSLVLPNISGLPADSIVWDFAIEGASLLIVQPLWTGLVNEALNNINAPGLVPLSARISDRIPRTVNALQLKYYDVTTHLDGSPAGSPVAVDTLTLTSAAPSSPLPEELAVALSYHADFTGAVEESGLTRPRARRRGRIYTGPYSTVSVDANADVQSTLLNALLGAAIHLNSASPTVWRVWSRKDAAMRPVIGGFVDNGWDVQRRRGPKAPTRTLWP